MRGRRRRLHLVLVAVHGEHAGRRPALLPGARHRRRRQRRRRRPRRGPSPSTPPRPTPASTRRLPPAPATRPRRSSSPAAIPATATSAASTAATFADCDSPHTTGTLGDGEHTLEVRAYDPAGNRDPTPASHTFIVDTDQPQTTITSGPPAVTDRRESRLRARGGRVRRDVRVPRRRRRLRALRRVPHRRARSPTAGTPSRPAPSTPPATSTRPPPRARFTVDTEPPQTTITAGPSGPTDGRDAGRSTFSDGTPDATFECRVDGGAVRAVRVAAPDGRAGRRRRTPSRCAPPTRPATSTRRPRRARFTVDTDAPDTTIDSGPAGPTTDATPTFDLGADEAGATFECRVDGGAFAACDSPFTTGAARRRRAHARRPRDRPRRQRRRDARPRAPSRSTPTAPDTTITAGPAGPTADATPTFAFTRRRAGRPLRVPRRRRRRSRACASPHTTAALADGEHTLRGPRRRRGRQRRPHARRRAPSPSTPTRRRPRSPPGPPARPTTPRRRSTFAADEAGATLRVPRRRRRLRAVHARRTPPTPLADGPHTFEVRADRPPPATPTRRRPRAPSRSTPTAPDTDDRQRAGRPDQRRHADVRLRRRRARRDVRVPRRRRRLRGLHARRSRPTPLADGDAHASRSAPSTPPATPTRRPRRRTLHGRHRAARRRRITAGPTRPDQRRHARRSTSRPTSPARRFECRIDGGAFAACDSPYTAAALGRRPRTPSRCARPTPPATSTRRPPRARFTVDTDAAGHDDRRPARPARRNDTTPTFDVLRRRGRRDASSAASTAATSRPARSPFTDRRARPTGDHTFEVRAVDAAGNADASPAVAHASRSTPTAPQTDDRRRPRPARPTTRHAGVHASAPTSPARRSSAGSTAARSRACAVAAHAPTRSADGEHTFEVRAIDAAGNADATPAVRARSRSTRTPPDTTIAAGPAGPTTDATPDVRVHRRGAGVDLRVPRRRRRRSPPCTSPPRPPPRWPTASHTFEVRATDRGRQRRPDAGVAHVHGRHRGARHDDRRRARAGPTQRRRRRRSRSPAARPARRSSAASTAAPSRRARRRTPRDALDDGAAHLRGPRDRRRGQRRRDSPRVARHGSRSTPRSAARDDDRRGAARDRRPTPRRTFEFTRRRAGATFECRGRRRRLRGVLVAVHDRARWRDGAAHLRGARHRRRRQRRPDAGGAHLHRRHRRAATRASTAAPAAPHRRPDADVHVRRPASPVDRSSAASTAATFAACDSPPHHRRRWRTARTPSRSAPTDPAGNRGPDPRLAHVHRSTPTAPQTTDHRPARPR